ncbi:MAG: ribosome recycling factor [Candidatus Magasanikbacteria bacterium RIFCSPLOWO2_02_FULL_44_11]|uniref:Ribosome-recycling factor n=2 Tax=Candidatus Magasanikiibacteriota TaxID=1752731 RepID=A0A1F6NA33_9BACT|nr:MAG: ribosome recycling factor [Candidatus Magasanikbacteria bacterium RIFCSPHIGHO2_02_FULL_45_10]OGH80777.1 MAG: ribosome recycling factor [Candidatus Magasanikbacteria bacterium RIFCSPLOWO2_02_FULL_44_11]
MNVQDFKKEFNAVIDFLKTDISQLRTGRATGAMLDSITVETYGSRQPLKAVGTITVADAKTINVEPWDKSQLGAIEKGIRDSGLGINPVNDGKIIRLILPELTSERRQELLKILSQKLESARISIRKVREEAREMVVLEEKEGGMSEDQKFTMFDEVEKLVKEYNEQIKKIAEQKEKEITSV